MIPNKTYFTSDPTPGSVSRKSDHLRMVKLSSSGEQVGNIKIRCLISCFVILSFWIFLVGEGEDRVLLFTLVAQAGVQSRNFSSLEPPPPGFK